MALLDNICEKIKLDIPHESDNVEFWLVQLNDEIFKIKHWNIDNINTNLILKELWLNEVRQLNRLKSIGNSSKYLELLHRSVIDENGYYLIYRTNEDTITLNKFVKQELEKQSKFKPKAHWVTSKGQKNLANRIILWKNILRVVKAIKILHEQGIVHRNISLDTILVDDSQEYESDKFILSGFEWSIYLNNLKTLDFSPIVKTKKINSNTSTDWISLGVVINELLGDEKSSINFSATEKQFLDILNDKYSTSLLLNAEVIEDILKKIIYELPQFEENYNTAYITCNSSLESDGYKKIRNNICKFVGEQLTHDEIFEFLSNDLSLTRINVRQAELNNKYIYLLRGRKLVYQVESFKHATPEWEQAYITNVFNDYPSWSDGFTGVECFNDVAYIKNSRFHQKLTKEVFNWSIVINQFEKDKIYTDSEKNCLRGLLLSHAIDTALFTIQKNYVSYEEINQHQLSEVSNAIYLSENYYYKINLIEKSHSREIFRSLNLKNPKERFYEQFSNDQNQDWYIEDTQLSNKQKLSFISSSDGNLIFASKVNLKVNLNVGGEYLLYPSNLIASEKQLIRRNYAFNKLVDQQHLLDSLIDPTECLQEMDYNYNIENSLNSLDVSKQKIFQQLLKVHPNYVVQGPPGVGKTYLISTLVKQIFEDERDSKIILSAQSHSTVQVLYDEIKKKVETDDLIIIDAFNNEENSEDDTTYNKITSKYLEKFSNSDMCKKVLNSYNNEVKLELKKILSEKKSYQFYNTILKSSNLIFTTTNSKTLEELIRNNINFDLSIMEESAKASGIELISPMLVSHKKIMIGDYLQLPAFGESVINNIVRNKDNFDYMLIFKELLNIGFSKEILTKLGLKFYSKEEVDAENEKEMRNIIISDLEKYFSVFRYLAKESQKIKARGRESFGDTINTQYRMHPEICNIVSSTVYNNILKTGEDKSDYYKLEKSNPIFFKDHGFNGDLNRSNAVIWLDIKDKNDQVNQISDYESDYTNNHEIEIIKNILESMHMNPKYETKSHVGVQILSPYRKQVEKINISFKNLKLNSGVIIENGSEIAKTVDSFQGDEADVIIISLVRHNSLTPYTRALGFLMDMRRMNVLLSRAKYKMIIVGCFKMFKFWSGYLNDKPESLMDNELFFNNKGFLDRFVDLASYDHNIMLNKNIKDKKFNYINFIPCAIEGGEV